jgi:2-polyprenyl-6-methoxyphenol hydroxylase-like FAD-dependent oxidoreductase
MPKWWSAPTGCGRTWRAVEAGREIDHPSLTCGYYAYWEGVPTEGVEFYVRAGRDILVFPTHDGLTCIWAGRPVAQWEQYRADVEAGHRATLELAPGLLSRVRAGRRVTPYKGTNKLPNFYRRAHGEGWALVGDAAYHRDPLTGMGIGDAFLGAALLADALADGFGGREPMTAALASYERTFRARTRPVFEYTIGSAALDDPGRLMPFYAGVAADPVATRQLMNVLAGTMPFRTLFNRESIARLAGFA